MWPWIKRWRDWAMNDLWPLYRIGPQPQAMHYSYEKAGLTVHDQPIPGTRRPSLVEALLRLPASRPAAARPTSSSALPGRDPVPAETAPPPGRPTTATASSSASPPPGETVTAELLWRDHVARPAHAAVSEPRRVPPEPAAADADAVRPPGRARASPARRSSPRQCQGLLASAVLTSPTSLVPLLDLDLQVEFRCERGGAAIRVPVRLCSSQLAGRQALVTVVPRRFPRRIGTWLATWMLGDQPPGHASASAAISQRAFQRSLRSLRHALRACRRPRASVTLCAAGAAAARGGRASGRASSSAAASRAWRGCAGCRYTPRCPARCSRRCCWSRRC